jgi:hypothetical protein
MLPSAPTVAVAMHRVVAFQSAPGLCPYNDFPAVFEYLAAMVRYCSSYMYSVCILQTHPTVHHLARHLTVLADMSVEH